MRCTTTTLTVACLVTVGLLSQSAGAIQTQAGNPDREAEGGPLGGEGRDTVVQPSESSLVAFQSDPVESPIPTDEWRFQFNSWAWLLGMEGDIGAGGTTTDVSADFGDILEASDSLAAFSGRFEFGKGQWGAFIDALYSNIGVDDVPGGPDLGDTDITFEMTLTDFGAMYRFREWVPEGAAANNSRNATLDLYGGGRYTTLDVEVSPTLIPSDSGDQDWLDPILGAKLVLPISERWHIAANGDVGGFGVGSDFTWSTTGVFGYEFTIFDRPATAFFGYRALGQDFTDGDGSAQFTWDVIMHGPILGFSLWF